MIDKKLLNELFRYENGKLIWNVQSNNRVKIGQNAGSKKCGRYERVGINGKLYSTHRLIFLFHHGFLPKVIDHIDGNTRNNKIENLREATANQNLANSKINKNNKSGVKGVSFVKTSKKWLAKIVVNKKYIYLGTYDDLNEAKKVVNKARKIYHKEFARFY